MELKVRVRMRALDSKLTFQKTDKNKQNTNDKKTCKMHKVIV